MVVDKKYDDNLKLLLQFKKMLETQGKYLWKEKVKKKNIPVEFHSGKEQYLCVFFYPDSEKVPDEIEL